MIKRNQISYSAVTLLFGWHLAVVPMVASTLFSLSGATALGQANLSGEVAERKYSQALDELRSGSASTAAKMWAELAAAGSSKAQYSLGLLLETGQGDVQQDIQRAIEYYTLAANAGVAEAQTNLGLIFAQGNGVDPNPELAVQYWQKSAATGHAMALFNLGLAYYQGTGVAADQEEAVALIYRAGMQNLKEAQYALGQFYSNGVGVPQSKEEALYWYRLAGRQGHADALSQSTDLKANGVAIRGAPEPSLKPREARVFAETNRKKQNMKSSKANKAPKDGIAKTVEPATNTAPTKSVESAKTPKKENGAVLASQESVTSPVPVKPAKMQDRALMMLSRSEAEIVYREALVILQSNEGDRLRNGRDAANRILSAALAGNAKAQRSLGEMYLLGVDLQRDEKESLFWMREAERNGIEDINGFATALEMMGHTEPSRPSSNPRFFN